MITSSFKKRRKFLQRTPGYRNFRPIRSLYSTVVFKIWSWSWAAKEYKRRPSKVCCVFFPCVCSVRIRACVSAVSVWCVSCMRAYVFCLRLFLCFCCCCCFLFWFLILFCFLFCFVLFCFFYFTPFSAQSACTVRVRALCVCVVFTRVCPRAC